MVQRCGDLPGDARIDMFLGFAAEVSSRKIDTRYHEEYGVKHAAAVAPDGNIHPTFADADGWDFTVSADEAIAMSDLQRRFFKEVDAFKLEGFADGSPPSFLSTENPHGDPWETHTENPHGDRWEKHLRILIDDLGDVVPSRTVVMESAFFLILEGLFDIPDVGGINVKAARAFLSVAVWLQKRMLQFWYDEGSLDASDVPEEHRRAFEFMQIIIGPGGSCKTTILKSAEALIDHFAGHESVRKCAISNTAARLVSGDTMHALCKLPRTDLQQGQSRLTPDVIKKHRRRWAGAVAVFIDEVSIVADSQLHQADVRIRQATARFSLRFGGLGAIFTGDFLQLPPVERQGLAQAISDVGNYRMDVDDDRADAADTGGGENEASIEPSGGIDCAAVEDLSDVKGKASAESRQGNALWRSVTNVISLSVNIRAPGLLSRLQHEMREGAISDDMWRLYLSRVLQTNDGRLQQETFASGSVQYIVHRHRIRVRQSYQNAIAACRRLFRRLYLIQACDDVKDEDSVHFTDSMRRTLLDCTNPRHTKGLCSFLPLYIGMRLLLCSKDCVRFGLMKGCECILEHIVFADEEDLPTSLVAGDPELLRFMPATLVLRALKAPWKVADKALPALPTSMSRWGLFQLRPTTEYVVRVVDKDRKIYVRRTQFAVLPADTRIVYGAQGETFDAVIADMQRPPRMDLTTFWLACYVMLSRARNIEGLLVLRPASRADLSRRPPKFLMDEIERLLQLEVECTNKLHDYISSLTCDVPSAILQLFPPTAETDEERRVLSVRTRTTECKNSQVATATDPPAQSASCPAPAHPGTTRRSHPDAEPPRRVRGKQASAALLSKSPSSVVIPCTTVGRPSECLRPEPGSTMSNDFSDPIPYAGIKPRAFRNMSREFGGGSCWINATLHALWSSTYVKRALAEVWMDTDVSLRSSLCAIGLQTRRPGTARKTCVPLANLRQRVLPPKREETYLAATFNCACTPPLTDVLDPYLLTDHYYSGLQADVGEFMIKYLLDTATSPRLSSVFHMELSKSLCCAGCGHLHAPLVETFGALDLPIHASGKDGRLYFSSQEALDAYMAGDRVQRAECCAGCGHSDVAYQQELRCVRPPDVLLLSLKRWRYVEDDVGAFHEICVDHAVRASETVDFAGRQYHLRSSILHLGSTAMCGHYITVSRHETSSGDWW